MRFKTAFAMPSPWTFEIPPIGAFVDRWLAGGGVSVDPFCGHSKRATYSNDMSQGGVDAEYYMESLHKSGVIADVLLFDPPYSPRQISECYKKVGRKVVMADTQNAAFYKRARNAARKVLRPGGIALSFGWSSCGFGVSWDVLEILLVRHGGAHNDTICVAQRSPALFRESTGCAYA